MIDGIVFDDVLLVPQYSEVESRENVDLSVEINKLSIKIKHPIIPANMKTISSLELLKEALY